MNNTLSVLSALLFSGTLVLGSPVVWADDAAKEGARSEGRAPGSSPGMESPMGASGERAARGEGDQQAAGDIKQVQEALKEKGHDPGPVDGILGPRTAQALKEFQQANGLEATGALNAETKAKLGIDAGEQPAREGATRQGQESRAPESRDGEARQPSPGRGVQR